MPRKQLSASEIKKRAQRRKLISKIVAYVLLSIGAVIMIFPFLWTLSTSFKAIEDIKDGKWIPDPWVGFDNYIKAWDKGQFGRCYMNSLIVSLTVTIAQITTSALAAYSFSRLKYPGRDKIFLSYLGTLMIPFVVTLIPVYLILRFLKLTDTYGGLIIPLCFSAYGTFMLRQFFMSIPKDLEEAAVIDGATKMGIFLRVIVPLSKAAIATLATFTFLWVWNEFLWPLVVINKNENIYTLPIALSKFQGQFSSEWNLLMAASLIVLIPVLIIYILNQKFITKGIVLSGLKG